jgi:mono/diheme cytochrome c family protein
MIELRRCRLSFLAFALLTGCGDDQGDPAKPGTDQQAITYWDDMAPLFAEHCTTCHRDGGIAPFRLDDYATAKSFAAAIKTATAERSMPPWGATSDGSCQNFSGNLALSDAQISKIGEWADSGAVEGEARHVEPPRVPSLDDGVVYTTPLFEPEVMGGELAEHDEYRCFLLDSGVTEPGFITAYDVEPGTPDIVHHAILMVVDPNAPASKPSFGTNSERMQALDAASERAGWPCFSGAGEGVEPDSSPVVWAPGQGVVEFPGNSGVPLRPTDKVVVQVHYNLAEVQGKSDQSRIKLRMAKDVENVGFFVLADPFLDTIEDPQPATLAPGLASVKYDWRLSTAQLGITDLPEPTLRGVMPHMHQLGHKYRMNIGRGAEQACGVDVQSWDFHWQRMYFYDDAIRLDQTSDIHVTCDFDTSERSEPVLPGWGTQNEMCLATLYVTAPRAALAR